MSARDDAEAIYIAALPQREQLGRGWRKVVVLTIMEKLGITEAAAASQFNEAKKRAEKKKAAEEAR